MNNNPSWFLQSLPRTLLSRFRLKVWTIFTFSIKMSKKQTHLESLVFFTIFCSQSRLSFLHHTCPHRLSKYFCKCSAISCITIDSPVLSFSAPSHSFTFAVFSVPSLHLMWVYPYWFVSSSGQQILSLGLLILCLTSVYSGLPVGCSFTVHFPA